MEFGQLRRYFQDKILICLLDIKEFHYFINYPDKVKMPSAIEASEIGKHHISLTWGLETHVSWMSSPKVTLETYLTNSLM